MRRWRVTSGEWSDEAAGRIHDKQVSFSTKDCFPQRSNGKTTSPSNVAPSSEFGRQVTTDFWMTPLLEAVHNLRKVFLGETLL